MGVLSSERAMSIRLTSDNSYILAGYTYSYGAGNGDAWLIKVSNEVRVHNINKGTNYSTIQSAIDDADSGNEIHVDSGTCYENVNVNKQLILRGIGMPVVDARGSGSAIMLTADGIILEGFNAIAAGSYPEAGIKVTSSRNTLSENNASNNNYGIFLSSSSNNTLSDNNASNNGVGIVLESSSNSMLSGNNASNNENGILFWENNNDNILSGNNAKSNTGDGIFFESSNNNTLSGNNAKSNNNYGIVLSSSFNNTLSKSDASNNIGGGIRLGLGSNNNTVSGNNISNNGGLGITGGRSVINNSIYNNIFNNTNNFYFSASNINTWNTTKQLGTNIIGGPYIGGNFWAQPDGNGYSQRCEDSEPDGICDLPFELDSNNIDYLPLAGGAQASTLLVCPIGCTYSSIQGAINDASGGDTIQVQSGTYYENVNVNKLLTLRGIDQPVVDAGGIGSAITLNADGILLEGFTAIGGGAFSVEAGIRVNSNNNTLSSNNASNKNYGIWLYSSNNNTLSGNNVSINGFGIYLTSSSNDNTLSENNANSNNNGIFLDSSSNNTLRGNNANSNNYGISLDPSSNNNTLTGNNASHNIGGFSLVSSSNNTLSGNNANSNNNGIYLGRASDNTLIKNIMTGNRYNFGLEGWSDSDYNNQIDTSNLVDEKSIYYLINAKNTVYDPSNNAGTCLLYTSPSPRD